MTRLQSWTGLSDSPAGPCRLSRVRITLFDALQLERLHYSLWQPGSVTPWSSSGLVGLQTSRYDPVFPRDCLGDCPQRLIATWAEGSLWRPGNLHHIVLRMQESTNCPAWKLPSLRTPQSAVPRRWRAARLTGPPGSGSVARRNRSPPLAAGRQSFDLGSALTPSAATDRSPSRDGRPLRWAAPGASSAPSHRAAGTAQRGCPLGRDRWRAASRTGR